MPNDFFLRLRLVGNRFSDHSIPFKALSGIVRFKDLVVEASRLEYLKHREHRERVPTGFSRSIELKLTSIKAGSAQLEIGMTSSGNLPLIPSQESHYLLGRDRLIQTIQRAGISEDAQGPEVSARMLQHFDKIAASIEVRSSPAAASSAEPSPLGPFPPRIPGSWERSQHRFLGSSQAQAWVASRSRSSRPPHLLASLAVAQHPATKRSSRRSTRSAVDSDSWRQRNPSTGMRMRL